MLKKECIITSIEVAQMVDKKHYDLLKDIRRYIAQLGEGKIPSSDFFTESTYTTEQNKAAVCYLVTKKGCEFIANKLTGQKGTEFTAAYINRFHEMEEAIDHPKLPQTTMELLELHYQAIKEVDSKVNEVTEDIKSVKDEVEEIKEKFFS